MTTIAALWKARAPIAFAIVFVAGVLLGASWAGKADKPLTETKTLTNTVTKTVQGPERIVYKYSIQTETCQPQIIEKIVEREGTTVEKNVEAVREKNDLPACSQKSKRWIVGVDADPGLRMEPQAVKAGITLWDSLDLTVGHSIKGVGKTTVGAGFRF